MANPLPPPPLKSPDGSYAWLDWYRKLQQYVSQGGSVPWNVIDFTNSNLADIAIKNHNVLDSIQGGTTGEFYHLTAAEHTAIATFVPNTRTLTAGSGLTGGGDLSANRTFDVGANADGSIVVNANDVQVGVLATDAQHGNRGGGALHAVATTSVSGFMSAADKITLDAMGTYQETTTTGTALPSATSTNAASFSLAAGDWDVFATILVTPSGGATLSNRQVGVSTTSATMPTTLGQRLIDSSTHTVGNVYTQTSPPRRLSLGSTTTVYAVAFASISGGTATVDGFLRARRVR